MKTPKDSAMRQPLVLEKSTTVTWKDIHFLLVIVKMSFVNLVLTALQDVSSELVVPPFTPLTTAVHSSSVTLGVVKRLLESEKLAKSMRFVQIQPSKALSPDDQDSIACSMLHQMLVQSLKILSHVTLVIQPLHFEYGTLKSKATVQ